MLNRMTKTSENEELLLELLLQVLFASRAVNFGSCCLPPFESMFVLPTARLSCHFDSSMRTLLRTCRENSAEEMYLIHSYGLTGYDWKQGNIDLIISSMFTACPELRFGVNCELTCRCPVNDTCDPQDGLCRSGRCAEGWGGASCQTSKDLFKFKQNSFCVAQRKTLNLT